jgi:hypothetical protein
MSRFRGSRAQSYPRPRCWRSVSGFYCGCGLRVAFLLRSVTYTFETHGKLLQGKGRAVLLAEDKGD